MKLFKNIALIVFIIVTFYGFGLLFDEYPNVRRFVPYVLIAIMYFRYEQRIEALGMDLAAVEHQLEKVSDGDWECDARTRKFPYL